MVGSSSKFKVESKLESKHSKFCAGSLQKVSRVPLNEHTRENIRDQREDLREIEKDSEALEDEIKEDKKEIKTISKCVKKLYAEFERLSEEIAMVKKVVVEQESLLKHKDRTIRHKRDILALVEDNEETIEERYKRLSQENQALENLLKNMRDAYKDMRNQLNEHVRRTEVIYKKVQQESPLLSSVEEEIKNLEEEVVRETRKQSQMEKDMERKLQDYVQEQDINDALYFKLKQRKLALMELADFILPEHQSMTKQLKKQKESLEAKRDALKHQFQPKLREDTTKESNGRRSFRKSMDELSDKTDQIFDRIKGFFKEFEEEAKELYKTRRSCNGHTEGSNGRCNIKRYKKKRVCVEVCRANMTQ